MTMTGSRTVYELRGMSCMPLELVDPARKGIAVTRSFGHPVTTWLEMREALASYATRAAEKMRRYKVAADNLFVFMHTNNFNNDSFYSNGASARYRCAVPGCTTLKRGKRSIAVHHRVPGNNDPKRLLSLCLACHAKITRTEVVRRDWPPFLRLLWREQHPGGHEQTRLDFGANVRVPERVPLFADLKDAVNSMHTTQAETNSSANAAQKKPMASNMYESFRQFTD